MSYLTTQVCLIAGLSVAQKPAWRSLLVRLAFIATALVLTTAAWGQDNAAITGTVTDSTGAAVASANITLTNTATGQVRQVTSNTAGSYLFPNVGVGRYTLETSVTGFQKTQT